MPITLPFALYLQTLSMWMAINFYVGNAVRLDKSIFSKMMLQLIHLEGEPGHLIMCDAKDCPFSFHFVCAGMSKDFIPEGVCCCFDNNNSLDVLEKCCLTLAVLFRRLVLSRTSI